MGDVSAVETREIGKGMVSMIELLLYVLVGSVVCVFVLAD